MLPIPVDSIAYPAPPIYFSIRPSNRPTISLLTNLSPCFVLSLSRVEKLLRSDIDGARGVFDSSADKAPSARKCNGPWGLPLRWKRTALRVLFVWGLVSFFKHTYFWYSEKLVAVAYEE